MRLKSKLLTVGCVSAAAVSLVCGMACNEHGLTPFSTSLSAGKKQVLDSGSARSVDILFVIDDSNSMLDEQENLDENFGSFIGKLIQANADFRLATTTTSDRFLTSPRLNFTTDGLKRQSVRSLLRTINRDPSCVTGCEKLTDADIDAMALECSRYFVGGKNWIESRDFVDLPVAERTTKIRNLFRCQALVGNEGMPIERGLSTLRKVLLTEHEFKRPDSILSIVFVTDENDCSDTERSSGHIQNDQTVQCETRRNIEDSCVMTRDDRVQRASLTGGSELITSPGQLVTYEGVTKSLRAWCVDGTETSRRALEWCVDNPVDCVAEAYIYCPIDAAGKKRCDNFLDTRASYFRTILDLVKVSNEPLYKKDRADLFNGSSGLTPAEIIRELDAMAKSDVIVASIINRDRGVRYNTAFPENWCGDAGNQSYRYQLFGEMFDNDPIYAPICCKSEAFYSATASGGAEQVCSEDSNGDNGAFGPVLGAIGQRIGEAVNTICTEAMPLTCLPSDCNESFDGVPTDRPRANPGPACTCMHGCNTKAYFANSDREYFLCNEFSIDVGTVPKGETDDKNFKPYVLDRDFMVNFESSYCSMRTGSPVQINLVTSEADKSLVIRYPKRVSGI